MLRHHGVLLNGLKNFLNELGIIVVIDAFDKLNDRSPSLPTMEQMYKELERAQKATGGARSAALKIQKRASVFGFRLLLAENIPARTRDEKTKLAQFRCFCFHVEILSKLFGAKYDRRTLLEEAKNWYSTPDSWGQFGLKVVIVQAIKHRARKRRRN